MSINLHWSKLRWMAESPAHFRYYEEAPVVETPAMRFGSLVDRIVFGMTDKVKVWGAQRRGNAWKEFRDAQHSDTMIVTVDEWARAEACAAAVRANDTANSLVSNGEKQRRLKWSIGNIPCAGTPDVVDIDEGKRAIITDLKVTPLVQPYRMARQTVSMKWHAQLMWYGNAVERIWNTPDITYWIVAVAPKPPHICMAYELSEDMRQRGEKLWRALLEQYQHCSENNHWPAYTDDGSAVLYPPDDQFTLEIDGEEVEV